MSLRGAERRSNLDRAAGGITLIWFHRRQFGQEREMSDASSGPGAIERPVLANEPGDYWGSDAVALMLREVDLPYVALNPGASYRGLHDSLVNLLGNRDPQMLLCLHEEHAVAIAHG